MDTLSYFEFDLQIERSGALYQARVINSPSGQASAEFALPFSDLEVEISYCAWGVALGSAHVVLPR